MSHTSDEDREAQLAAAALGVALEHATELRTLKTSTLPLANPATVLAPAVVVAHLSADRALGKPQIQNPDGFKCMHRGVTASNSPLPDHQSFSKFQALTGTYRNSKSWGRWGSKYLQAGSDYAGVQTQHAASGVAITEVPAEVPTTPTSSRLQGHKNGCLTPASASKEVDATGALVSSLWRCQTHQRRGPNGIGKGLTSALFPVTTAGR
eukprot:CAMPEP_0174370936 /NCGR_PEP_ID=MMETSP0811_2-20130205/97931_1 /TAXON_ID=73025 ORGANISM="Eutreptiella gymnastica-like, Strain CCMP1594" /NCGR_SAMPLE_ID=MMETSP0811_2 /ASSEMBLY_ACC=CAM_ASM_000667 /LENGTH=208 /DNA_ID=CAMNT_0015516847 /DNA_START=587 /DNA_END=1214 /DNA_ORIENTATION=+